MIVRREQSATEDGEKVLAMGDGHGTGGGVDEAGEGRCELQGGLLERVGRYLLVSPVGRNQPARCILTGRSARSIVGGYASRLTHLEATLGRARRSRPRCDKSTIGSFGNG